MAVPTFAAVTGSLKAAADTAKAMINLRDAVLFQAKANELQGQIASALADAVSAYDAQSTQLQRIRELEEKVATFEAWETEKQRYDLKNLGWGGFAYMLKPAARGTEPPHWACTNCYGNRRISVIQWGSVPNKTSGRRNGYFCPACKNELHPSTEALALGTQNPRWLD